MMREAEAEDVLDAAVRRLERATAMLESRMAGLLSTAKAEAGGLFDQDRAKLADELDAARGRERELQAAGQQAAQALDKAIAEIRAVLSEGDAPAAQDEEA
jgi:hypothetical protein